MTNYLRITVDSSAVFECISRINHSCVPNVEVLWDDEQQTMAVFAYRDIKNGEEIVRTYFDDLLGHELVAVRNAALAREFSFECECVRCLNEQKYWGGKLASEKRERKKRREIEVHTKMVLMEKVFDMEIKKERSPNERIYASLKAPVGIGFEF
jgi:SET domain